MRIIRATKERPYSKDRKKRKIIWNHKGGDRTAEKHGETER
jgi:hypothetical protein